ncbi:MAG: GFA family protein [Alphaproteobacteria bacterium]
MNDEKSYEGGCLCGAVRYRCRGRPGWIAHCHCESCRRAGGTVIMTWAGYTPDTYKVTAGFPVRFASSSGVQRSFCGNCGTPLTYESKRWPGEVHVTVGTLDRADDFPPERHVHADERLPWLHLDDGLPSRGRD